MNGMIIRRGAMVAGDAYAITKRTNAHIMDSFYAAYGPNGTYVSRLTDRGLRPLSSPDHITFDEAASFVGGDFNPTNTTGGSIFHAQRNNITHFEEIQHFTGLTSLPAYCFYFCKLKTITLPTSITSLETQSFYQCTSLTYFEGPNVKSLGAQVFAYCSALVTIRLPECTSFAAGAIGASTNSLKELYTPKLANGGSYMLAPNGNVGGTNTRWTVGPLSGVQSYAIRSQVQRGWTLIMSKYCNVDIPYIWRSDDSTKNQKFAAFEVEPENTVFEIRNGCVVKIANNTVMAIPYMGNIEIHDSVTAISANAGSGCSSITSISIPSSVTSIGAAAFANCTSLKNITLDMTATPPTNMFTGCTAVESIHLGPHYPSSLANLAQTFYHAGHGTITSLTVDENNPTYTDDGNCFYNPSTHNILFGCSTSTIPSDCTTIGNYAFAFCKNLPSTIPSSVTTIKTFAFANSEFVNGSLVLTNVSTIGGNAFQNITTFNTIDISSSITSLGNSAFQGCSNVQTIYFRKATAPTITTSTWGGASRTATGYQSRVDGNTNVLYVPSSATGYDTTNWKYALCNASYGGFTLSKTL